MKPKNREMSPESPPKDGETVAYIRSSTIEQEQEHQTNAIKEWLEDNQVSLSDVEFLRETASGAAGDREEFKKLVSMVDNDKVDHVVVWELSRIAREGELAQRFFNRCEDNGVTVHITSGSLKRIEPDGTNRFVADVLAAVYAEERRTLIRRIKHGQQRAVDNGKWVGQPPLGFTTDPDGYLIPNVPTFDGYDDSKDGFYAVESAVEAVEKDDKSQRSIADDMECSRPALGDLCDEDRAEWFLYREADDDRVQNALDELEMLERAP